MIIRVSYFKVYFVILQHLDLLGGGRRRTKSKARGLALSHSHLSERAVLRVVISFSRDIRNSTMKFVHVVNHFGFFPLRPTLHRLCAALYDPWRCGAQAHYCLIVRELDVE